VSLHVEVAATVRSYLHDGFSLPAGEWTTEECVGSRSTRDAIEEAPRALLAETLSRCDLVKFARDLPAAKEREALLDTAESFVRRTAPTPNSGEG